LRSGGTQAIVCALHAAEPPRRILLATTGIYVGGGIASVSRCIARTLAEEREAGRLESFDTLSLLDAPAGPQPPLGGVQLHARGSQLRFAFQLWRALRRSDPDLVVFDHAGLARAMRLPLPGVSRPAYAIFAHGGELAVVTKGRRRAVFEAAQRVLTNSEFTARYVRECFPSLADRVHPVPLCIDPDLVELWEKDLPDAPADREAAVLIVGRMWSSERGKGHDALLAALPRVRERVPHAELWIVGAGDDVPRLERTVRERGLAGAVRFFGRVSDHDLGRLYRSAGVFAMPSRQEGFGLVYAEAMWHGLPCIGSTLDAAGELISDGRTGLLVPYDAIEPLANAIVGLLSDRELATRMGNAAADQARRRFTYARFRIDLLGALGLAPFGVR
jgi:phosphatidylinositol alpha-1,6-mannosyltransferase